MTILHIWSHLVSRRYVVTSGLSDIASLRSALVCGKVRSTQGIALTRTPSSPHIRLPSESFTVPSNGGRSDIGRNSVKPKPSKCQGQHRQHYFPFDRHYSSIVKGVWRFRSNHPLYTRKTEQCSKIAPQ